MPPRGVATVDQANADVDASPSVRSYWRIPYPRAVIEREEASPLAPTTPSSSSPSGPMMCATRREQVWRTSPAWVVAAASSIEEAISSSNASPRCSVDIHVPLGYHVSVRVGDVLNGRLSPAAATQTSVLFATWEANEYLISLATTPEIDMEGTPTRV